MCGIVGYIGKNNPKDILLNCLKKLEYRGYDSSGIALKNKNDLQIIKSVGKIKNLEENCIPQNIVDMAVENYDEFLVERRKMMAALIQSYYQNL